MTTFQFDSKCVKLQSWVTQLQLVLQCVVNSLYELSSAKKCKLIINTFVRGYEPVLKFQTRHEFFLLRGIIIFISRFSHCHSTRGGGFSKVILIQNL